MEDGCSIFSHLYHNRADYFIIWVPYTGSFDWTGKLENFTLLHLYLGIGSEPHIDNYMHMHI